MKSTLIRTLAVLTFATWMSAFAAVNYSENEAAKGNASQNQTTKTETNERQKTKNDQNKTKKAPKESQQDKEFDHALLGIHG